MPLTHNVAAKCLPKKHGVQSRLSEQRYFFKNACLDQTLRSTAQLWRYHSLLTKPPRAQLTPPQGQRAVPWGSSRSCPPGSAQGSSSLEHLHKRAAAHV